MQILITYAVKVVFKDKIPGDGNKQWLTEIDWTLMEIYLMD